MKKKLLITIDLIDLLEKCFGLITLVYVIGFLAWLAASLKFIDVNVHIEHPVVGIFCAVSYVVLVVTKKKRAKTISNKKASNKLAKHKD